jgi:hypothetical protein
VEGVADLQHMGRPGGLPERHLLRADFASPQHAEPQDGHPEQQPEGQRDLREHRQQDSLDRHGALRLPRAQPQRDVSAPRAVILCLRRYVGAKDGNVGT